VREVKGTDYIWGHAWHLNGDWTGVSWSMGVRWEVLMRGTGCPRLVGLDDGDMDLGTA